MREVSKVSNWRNSLATSEALPQSYFSLPDFDLLFLGNRTYHFAVECKWQKEFVDGKITWARPNQITTYRRYEMENNIRVFVAIGIGGEPSNPEKLFVTPLQDIFMYDKLSELQSLLFKRKPTKRFFDDTVQCKLF